MIFPGFPGDLSFIHVEWEPCDVIYSKQSIHQVVTFFAKKLTYWVKSSKNHSTFTTKIFRHLTKQQKVHCFNIDVANLPSLSLVYPTTFLREYSNHPRLPSQHRPLVTSTFKTRNQDRLSTFQINPQICCIPVHVLQFDLICLQN